MKQGIHPDYHTITIRMTDGTEFETRSTYGKKGDSLQLDIDPNTHPAWTGKNVLLKNDQLSKFQNRFKNYSMKK